MTIDGKHQIGEVADAVGLSIRTIRHYDEMGVVEPSGRSAGGFRLYTDDDLLRLGRVKRLKPMNFSLEEIQELLELEDRVGNGTLREPDRQRLEFFLAAAEASSERLRQQLDWAGAVAEELRLALRPAAPTRRG